MSPLQLFHSYISTKPLPFQQYVALEIDFWLLEACLFSLNRFTFSFLCYANPLHMSIFLLLPHPIYNCPMCDEAMSEVPEGKLLNWERRKHIFIHERFQVLPSPLSPSASLPFFPSRTEHAASRFVCDFFFFSAAQGLCMGLRNAKKS